MVKSFCLNKKQKTKHINHINKANQARLQGQLLPYIIHFVLGTYPWSRHRLKRRIELDEKSEMDQTDAPTFERGSIFPHGLWRRQNRNKICGIWWFPFSSFFLDFLIRTYAMIGPKSRREPGIASAKLFFCDETKYHKTPLGIVPRELWMTFAAQPELAPA